MTHFATADFWYLCRHLPIEVRNTADKSFSLLRSDSRHPSLHFKKIGELWSVRAGSHYRALGVDAPDQPEGISWFWIGSHAEYDRIVKLR